MQIGVLKEQLDQRVAVVPDTVKKFVKAGHTVLFESKAGEKSFAYDNDYEKAGAKVADRKEVLATSDLLITIRPISESEVTDIKKDAVLIALFEPFQDASICEKFAKNKLTAFSFDMIPRSTIAQSMDVLSSMASIAGYKAVLKATEFIPRYVPMLSTAAGTIPPSKVLVLGAGVAGLQAIATAKRLGGMVEAFDTRAAAKEEVMSLGAKFVEVEGAADDKNAGGYAVEQSEEYKQKQRELIKQKVEKADIVITTAQLRGRKAPILVTEEMLKNMKKGAVVVDMASSTGGNCELVEDGKAVVKHGITIVGNSNLADDLSEQSSLLYSRNVENFLKILWTDNQFDFAFDNEILRNSCIVFEGGSVYGDSDKLPQKSEKEVVEAN